MEKKLARSPREQIEIWLSDAFSLSNLNE